jgi:ABC-type lipoprotein release transport system permease subunit
MVDWTIHQVTSVYTVAGTALATYWPAHRASLIDPDNTLLSE